MSATKSAGCGDTLGFPLQPLTPLPTSTWSSSGLGACFPITSGSTLPVYEYRAVRLRNEGEGIAVAMSAINGLAAEGWRLLELTMPDGWGIMERARPS